MHPGPAAYPLQDAAIIGGGPAGLSAALVLARSLHSVTVVDADRRGVKARSTWPQVNYNLLGWPDGIAAAELRSRGRQQLSDYPVELTDASVSTVKRADTGFVLDLDNGRRLGARTLLIATGVQDHYPEFPGWETYVGRSLHWCLACDGYEARGSRVVAIGNNETAALDALQLLRFTPHVTLLTGAETPPRDDLMDRLHDAGVGVVVDTLAGAEGYDGRLGVLITAAGRRIACDHAFSLLPATPRGELAAQLGAAVEEGYVTVDSEQRTSVACVFAAGDVTRVHSHQLATALHEGTQAGHAMTYELSAGT